MLFLDVRAGPAVPACLVVRAVPVVLVVPASVAGIAVIVFRAVIAVLSVPAPPVALACQSICSSCYCCT